MNLQEMISLINSNVDDVVATTDAVMWLNVGKNKMAISVGASFPDIAVTSDLSDAFVFPAKYHHIPVLYSCAAYKGQDTSLQEKGSFMQEFLDGIRDFQTEYSVPEYYRDDNNSEQFTATAGQSTFTITKNAYDSQTGDLKIYINGKQTFDFTPNTDVRYKDFTLSTVCNEGDKVTAIWEIHTDLMEAPYSWWNW
jgi:hypothetical protein